MTRTDLTRVVETASEELNELQNRTPAIRAFVSLALCLIASALITSKRQSDLIAMGTLRGSARVAGEAITGAIQRHPEITVDAARLLDVAAALVAVGT